MSPRDLVYVGHMLDMAKKAISKTQSLSRAAYDEDENLRLALTHLIQIIGEAGRQVSREFTEQHPEIPWAGIVWQVVTEDLHTLVAALEPIVPPTPPVTNGH